MATPMTTSELESQLLPPSAKPTLYRSWSVKVGLPMNSLHLSILLMACLLGVIQYGIISIFGIVIDDELEAYYHLDAGAGDQLYDIINIGSCAMSFLPGLIYDKFGAMKAMLLGTVLALLPITADLYFSGMFPWLRTLAGLKLSYFILGTSASFFSVVSSFAPLEAFPEEHIGKVSAIVQVSSSLGVTIQSEVYGLLVEWFSSDFVRAYYIYMLVTFGLCGALMTCVFWADSDLLHKSKASSTYEPILTPPEQGNGNGGLISLLLSVDFLYMSAVFGIGIGFVYSYLDAAGNINIAAGLPASRATLTWGIYGVIGRLGSNLLLDRTRHSRFGGPLTYCAASLLVFAIGLLCVSLPAAPGLVSVHLMNLFCGIGGGAILGVTPAALRLLFGSEFVGIIYGILYAFTALGMIAWGLLIPDPASCGLVTCYRSYCLRGAVSLLVTCGVGLALTTRTQQA